MTQKKKPLGCGKKNMKHQQQQPIQNQLPIPARRHWHQPDMTRRGKNIRGNWVIVALGFLAKAPLERRVEYDGMKVAGGEGFVYWLVSCEERWDTPWKIYMKHNNGSLEDDVPFLIGWCLGSMWIFRGVLPSHSNCAFDPLESCEKKPMQQVWGSTNRQGSLSSCQWYVNDISGKKV